MEGAKIYAENVIRNKNQAKKLFSIGIEKIIINSAAFENPQFIKELSTEFGSQSIVVCVDIKKNLRGKYTVFVRNGKINTKKRPPRRSFF